MITSTTWITSIATNASITIYAEYFDDYDDVVAYRGDAYFFWHCLYTTYGQKKKEGEWEKEGEEEEEGRSSNTKVDLHAACHFLHMIR